jgi:16S rRNA (uracil1498-N3)-methyltransferase
MPNAECRMPNANAERRMLFREYIAIDDNSIVPLPRFHAPDLDVAARGVRLPPDEAKHLTRVLRLGVGDDVAVFDGRGREFHARVTAAARDAVDLELVAPLVPAPESRVPLTLVQAVLKGDKMDEVVRDATMMGVTAIEPVITARTIVRQTGREPERWTRVAVSSAKQCGRATVPGIAPARPFAHWLATHAHGLPLILVEPSAAAGDESSLRLLEHHAAGSIALIVGPEGGWTPEERQEAVARACVAVTLGGLTLRADAIPIAALAVVRFALKDF